MNILVVNGSPGGKESVTLQTVRLIQKHFKDQSFEVLNVGQQIKVIEKNFAPARKAVEKADILLWAYPVYTFLVPSQLHRFMELLTEEGVDMQGKASMQISTSMHFYDVTAHRFVKDFCGDCGMKYIGGLSAGMEDLLKIEGRIQAVAFFRHALWAYDNGLFEDISTTRSDVPKNMAQPKQEKLSTSIDHKIVIVADAKENERLQAMIQRFRSLLGSGVEVVELNDYPFAGGCLGCFHCASDGKCIYKDGFDTFLREHIQGGEAIVYAFQIKSHSMGSLFKMFDDRQFCNGHRTVTMGKPMAYLIDGDLQGEENLKTLIEARAQVGDNPLAGMIDDTGEVDLKIDLLAKNLVYCLENPMEMPQNFYGVGGMKIFRDLIYVMQGMMREDHRFYKKHGFYDFPQKNRMKVLAVYALGILTRNEKFMKKNGLRMRQGMVMPYEAILKKDEDL